MKILPLGEYAYTTEIYEIIKENGIDQVRVSSKVIEIPYATQAEFDKIFGSEKKFVNGILADIPFEEKKERLAFNLRGRRNRECFSFINRGKIWYDTLSDDKMQELKAWYNAWLDVTETLTVPIAPAWLK